MSHTSVKTWNMLIKFVLNIILQNQIKEVISPLSLIKDARKLKKIDNCVRQRYQLIRSRDIDVQRTLESSWTRRKPSNTRPKVVVSDATFPWWLNICKKTNILLDSFPRYWRSKNSKILLDQRHVWSHPTQSGSLRCYIPLITISMQKKLKY